MYKGCIYRHWIVIDGVEVSYIGLHKGTNPQKDRWNNGKGYKPRKNIKNNKFYDAILDYGWENFNHEIIGYVEAETMEQLALDLDEWEKFYIWKYDSFYNGFNGTTGGSGGYVMSNETKQKIREKAKTRTGEKNPMYGKHHSQQVRDKCREVNLGKKMSEHTKQKIKKTLKEKPYQAKKIICLNTGQVFDSIVKAGDWCNGQCGNMTACCKGRLKHCGKHPETGEKLKWMYYDEYLKLQEEQQNKTQDLVTEVA